MSSAMMIFMGGMWVSISYHPDIEKAEEGGVKSKQGTNCLGSAGLCGAVLALTTGRR
jgi:hypothetical protein